MSAKSLYSFGRSERSLFSEIYFPKKAAHQGAIYDALRFGYDAEEVRKYMRVNVTALLKEFSIYPWLLDPNNYTASKEKRSLPTRREALKRIEMYESPFQGWSTYSVDGVFFGTIDKMYEEATQVVRIMFRFDNNYEKNASKARCSDVLRAMLFWAINRQGRLDVHKLWCDAEKERFISSHEPWPKHKRAFVEKHYTSITRQVAKWIDDRALFTFAYLVRKFSENVKAEHLYEEQIWVTSLFTQVLNVVSRVEGKSYKRRT